MSTRGCIARLTSKPGKKIKFAGVWNHWDSYPSALGSTLYNVRNDYFKGDTNAMLKYLIDQHPQGFSTINNCDFNLPSAPRIDGKLCRCATCGLPNWRHYRQYYEESNHLWVEAGRPPCPPRPSPDSYLVADHTPQDENLPHGPECYPPERNTRPVTEKNASGMGVEYVYAFTPDGKMLVLSSYCSDDVEGNPKMVGFFGCGDKNAKWLCIGEIDLDGIEPTEEQWGMVPIEQLTFSSVEKKIADFMAEKVKQEKKEQRRLKKEAKRLKEQKKLDEVWEKSNLKELAG